MPREYLEARCRARAASLELEYFLYSSRIGRRDSYSVRVRLHDEGRGTRESEEVNDITSLRDEALRIFSAVSDGLVTPMTLYDVIYDLIG